MSSIKSAKPAPSKVTRAEIAAHQEREAAQGKIASNIACNKSILVYHISRTPKK